MAVITDYGDMNDIHPKEKKPVAKRLALAARALAYKEDVVYIGPVYDSMIVSNGGVFLSFKHAAIGLVAKEGPLKGFTIAGDERKFFNAQARIEGIVSSYRVPRSGIRWQFGMDGQTTPSSICLTRKACPLHRFAPMTDRY